MFKIPKWEDDVPKSNVAFGKAVKHKKEKKGDINSPMKKPQNLNKSERNTTPEKRKKLKRKDRKKINRTDNNNQTDPPQFSMKLKGAEVANETAAKNKDKKSRKRKHDKVNSEKTKIQTQASPEKIIKAKKKKITNIEGDLPEIDKISNITENLPNGDSINEEETISKPVLNKIDKKKEKFRKLLQMESNRNHINVSGNNLRKRMLERLKAAQFRFLNEKLYTTSGSEAQKLFQSDPEAFHTYHQGYQQQLKKWPVNPLDLIVKRISKMPKTHIVADMGCGEAALAGRVPHQVRSFDLVASGPGVEACDMARTPLLTASVDVAVYCLALMGTDLTQYLVEANRVLKMGGHLLIAEVESRFDKVESFTDDVQRLGFKLKKLDKSHQVFFFMEFTKVRDPPAKKSKLPTLTLKPCLYKRRYYVCIGSSLFAGLLNCNEKFPLGTSDSGDSRDYWERLI